MRQGVGPQTAPEVDRFVHLFAPHRPPRCRAGRSGWSPDPHGRDRGRRRRGSADRRSFIVAPSAESWPSTASPPLPRAGCGFPRAFRRVSRIPGMPKPNPADRWGRPGRPSSTTSMLITPPRRGGRTSDPLRASCVPAVGHRLLNDRKTAASIDAGIHITGTSRLTAGAVEGAVKSRQPTKEGRPLPAHGVALGPLVIAQDGHQRAHVRQCGSGCLLDHGKHVESAGRVRGAQSGRPWPG